jgi:hypothetical protein
MRTWEEGAFERLLADVTSRVFDVYGDSTVVYPGHCYDTTLGAERRTWAMAGAGLLTRQG